MRRTLQALLAAASFGWPATARRTLQALWVAASFGWLATAEAQSTVHEKADRTVVFVVPDEVDAALSDSVVEALQAQFAGGEAGLTIERFRVRGSELREQVDAARELARAKGATGVFWVDPFVANDWLLYLSEPSGDRVLVRRITLEGASTGAAAEAVAVITRQSTSALLDGRTIGMRPVEIAPAPAPAPPKPPKPPATEPTTPSGPVLFVAYRGNTYADQLRWQSGFNIGGGWLTPIGLYMAFGYVVFPDVQVEDELATFEVRRQPFELAAGWRFHEQSLSLDAELATVFDRTSRRLLAIAAPLGANPNDSRVVFSLSPRGRLEYAASDTLGLYISTGIDFAINAFPFVAQVGGEQRALLSPHRVRVVLNAGIAVWP